jgi:hypothetical protein
MSQERAPVGAFAPRSRAAQAYRQLWAEARDRAGVAGPFPAAE